MIDSPNLYHNTTFFNLNMSRLVSIPQLSQERQQHRLAFLVVMAFSFLSSHPLGIVHANILTATTWNNSSQSLTSILSRNEKNEESQTSCSLLESAIWLVHDLQQSNGSQQQQPTFREMNSSDEAIFNETMTTTTTITSSSSSSSTSIPPATKINVGNGYSDRRWLSQRRQGENEERNGNHLRRRQAVSATIFVQAIAVIVSSSSQQARYLQEEDKGQGNTDDDNSTSISFLQARRCTCINNKEDGNDTKVVYYCPIEADSCHTSMADDSTASTVPVVHCRIRMERRETAAAILEIASVFFVLIVLLLIITEDGHSCLDYVIGTLCGITQWNVYSANRMIHRNPARARGLIGMHIMRNRHVTIDTAEERGANNNDTAERWTLSFPTKIYNNSEEDNHQKGGTKRGGTDIGGAEVSDCSTQDSDAASDTAPDSASGSGGDTNSKSGAEDDDISIDRLVASIEEDDASSPRTSITTIDEKESTTTNQTDIDAVIDNTDDDDDDDDAPTCSICLIPLEQGDRLGALDCNHLFHVECLKMWVQRRNCCPLCQAPNLAKLCVEKHNKSKENNCLHYETQQEEQEQDQPNE